jgi:flagellar protein FlgJ
MVTAAEQQFIDSIAPAAQASQRATRIPASIKMAQAIIESAWGKSKLTVEGHNYFGIKAVQGQDYCEFPTKEFIDGKPEIVQAKFARYASATECFLAHARLLAGLKRYAPAMACCNDPAQFAAQLQKCGYSTNPQYADLLMSLVREFNLTQYDVPEPEPPAAMEAAA